MVMKEKHCFSDCLYWNLLALLPVGAACLAIAADSLLWVVFYLTVFLFNFLVVEYRFFCSHCPHYIKSRGTMKCMFLWGMPKVFKPRPGPLGRTDKIMMAFGLAVMVLLPVYWLMQKPLILGVYVMGWLILAWTMKRYECSQCIYLHCPMNTAKKRG
jgi:hypothetical protein